MSTSHLSFKLLLEVLKEGLVDAILLWCDVLQKAAGIKHIVCKDIAAAQNAPGHRKLLQGLQQQSQSLQNHALQAAVALE